MARGTIRIGVSGWTYSPWRGAFYPEGLRQKDELGYAARQFNALEVNGTFYGLQRPAAFAAWAEAVPEDFVFAVKGSRFITHTLRLKDSETALANFLASGVLRLGSKLGPLLWQLPPNFRFDAERIEAFLKLLPRDTSEAAALAQKHDERLKGRAWLRPGPKRAMRHALEIRHESFRDPAFPALLRRYNVALVVADTVKWPCLMDRTADFIYVRLHGGEELYRSRYSEAQLDEWEKRIRGWTTGKPLAEGDFAGARSADRRRRDVFLFFDNTDKLHAPDNARELMVRLGVEAAGSQAGDRAGK